MQTNVPYNETLFTNVVMLYDSNHIGGQSLNRIKFRFVNSKGLGPNNPPQQEFQFDIRYTIIDLETTIAFLER